MGLPAVVVEGEEGLFAADLEVGVAEVQAVAVRFDESNGVADDARVELGLVGAWGELELEEVQEQLADGGELEGGAEEGRAVLLEDHGLLVGQRHVEEVEGLVVLVLRQALLAAGAEGAQAVVRARAERLRG